MRPAQASFHGVGGRGGIPGEARPVAEVALGQQGDEDGPDERFLFQSNEAGSLDPGPISSGAGSLQRFTRRLMPQFVIQAGKRLGAVKGTAEYVGQPREVFSIHFPDLYRHHGRQCMQIEYGMIVLGVRRQVRDPVEMLVAVGRVAWQLPEFLQRHRQRQARHPVVAHSEVSGEWWVVSGEWSERRFHCTVALGKKLGSSGTIHRSPLTTHHAMKIGIAGFASSGKSTVFQWLTGVKPDMAKAQFGQAGIARVPDERLDWLSAHFKPKKTTAATIEFLDTPGLMPSERRDNPRRLGILRDANGLVIVLTGYSGGNLANEFRGFREEMLFADLEIVTNRIDKVGDLLKKARPAKQRELDLQELALLQRVAKALEEQKPASSLGLKEDEEKAIRSFQLLTLKPELVLVNIGDDGIGKPLPADLLALAPNALTAPAKLELELEELPADDRQAFMTDLGLSGFSRHGVIRSIFAAMGRQVFFTVGEDECRSWGIRTGADAVEGAGEIHTDLSRGFVRAEVVGYEDFKRVGSMKEAKTRGVYRLEGKTYIVKDGDIMHILAST